MWIPSQVVTDASQEILGEPIKNTKVGWNWNYWKTGQNVSKNGEEIEIDSYGKRAWKQEIRNVF